MLSRVMATFSSAFYSLITREQTYRPTHTHVSQTLPQTDINFMAQLTRNSAADLTENLWLFSLLFARWDLRNDHGQGRTFGFYWGMSKLKQASEWGSNVPSWWSLGFWILDDMMTHHHWLDVRASWTYHCVAQCLHASSIEITQKKTS